MGLDKRRVAVIGVGYLGKLHAEKYKKTENAELVGVADTSPARVKEIAALCNTQGYTDYKALFGKVDAVSIVTPTESHCKIGLDFLSRGVDVLMEKPIAMNTAEAERLITEAKKNGAVLQVGHLERFNGAYVALGGRVKNPVYMECRRLSPFPNRSTDVDVILDVMIHDIDIILSLVKSEVESVEATGLPIVTSKLDICNARLSFKNGCAANITASRAAKDKVRRLEVFQNDASFDIDFMNHALTVSRPVPGVPFGKVEDCGTVTDKRDSILEELRSFLKCSVEKSAPAISGEDGKKALEVAELIQAAAQRRTASR